MTNIDDLPPLPEWHIPAGTMVHMNGIPYWLKSDAVLLGANNPEHFQIGAYCEGFRVGHKAPSGMFIKE